MTPPPSHSLNHTPLGVAGLRVTLGGHPILRGIDLSIADGQFVSLVGRSGSGKSTLLHTWAGFLPADRGSRIDRAGDVAVVLQHYGIFPWLTAAQNVRFALRHLPRGRRSAEVDRLLALAGLTGHGKKYPAQLSGGQVQRVALARALGSDADAVFTDEPFAALDLITREECGRWLLDVWESTRKTILFCTHAIDEAILLGDRLVVLTDGRVAGDFAIDFPRPRVDQIRYSTAFGALRAQAMAAMNADPAQAAPHSNPSERMTHD